jgi:hypothetical protein
MVLVREDNLPRVHRALTLMWQDHGLPGKPEYQFAHVDDLGVVESALAALSDEDLETFVAGEHDEMLQIASRSQSLGFAHEVLELYFVAVMGG